MEKLTQKWVKNDNVQWGLYPAIRIGHLGHCHDVGKSSFLSRLNDTASAISADTTKKHRLEEDRLIGKGNSVLNFDSLKAL